MTSSRPEDCIRGRTSRTPRARLAASRQSGHCPSWFGERPSRLKGGTSIEESGPPLGGSIPPTRASCEQEGQGGVALDDRVAAGFRKVESPRRCHLPSSRPAAVRPRRVPGADGGEEDASNTLPAVRRQDEEISDMPEVALAGAKPELRSWSRARQP